MAVPARAEREAEAARVRSIQRLGWDGGDERRPGGQEDTQSMKGETGKGSSEIAKGRRRERERWKALKSQEKSGFFNKTRLFLKIIRSLDSKIIFSM